MLDSWDCQDDAIFVLSQDPLRRAALHAQGLVRPPMEVVALLEATPMDVPFLPFMISAPTYNQHNNTQTTSQQLRAKRTAGNCATRDGLLFVAVDQLGNILLFSFSKLSNIPYLYLQRVSWYRRGLLQDSNYSFAC